MIDRPPYQLSRRDRRVPQQPSLYVRAIAGIVAATAAFPAPAAPDPRAIVDDLPVLPSSAATKVFTATAAVPAAAAIVIEGTRGIVTIAGRDEAVVAVRVDARFKHDVPPAAAAVLNQYAARIDSSASQVTISATGPTARSLEQHGGDRAIALSYTIDMPRTARLRVRHDVGSVAISGVTADLDIAAKVGDIRIDTPPDYHAALKASSTIGDVSVGRRRGAATRVQQVLLGQRYRDQPVDAAHRIDARIGIGSIEIE